MKYIKLMEAFDASKRIGPFLFTNSDDEDFKGVLYNIDIKFKIKTDLDRYAFYDIRKDNEEILNSLRYIVLIFTFDSTPVPYKNRAMNFNLIINNNIEIQIPASMDNGKITLGDVGELLPKLKFINKEQELSFKEQVVPLILKFKASWNFFNLFSNYSSEWKKIIKIIKNTNLHEIHKII